MGSDPGLPTLPTPSVPVCPQGEQGLCSHPEQWDLTCLGMASDPAGCPGPGNHGPAGQEVGRDRTMIPCPACGCSRRSFPVTPCWLYPRLSLPFPSGDPSFLLPSPACPAGSAGAGHGHGLTVPCAGEGARPRSCPLTPFDTGREIPPGITGSRLSPAQPHLPEVGFYRGLEVGRGRSGGANRAPRGWELSLVPESPFWLNCGGRGHVCA